MSSDNRSARSGRDSADLLDNRNLCGIHLGRVLYRRFVLYCIRCRNCSRCNSYFCKPARIDNRWYCGSYLRYSSLSDKFYLFRTPNPIGSLRSGCCDTIYPEGSRFPSNILYLGIFPFGRFYLYRSPDLIGISHSGNFCRAFPDRSRYVSSILDTVRRKYRTFVRLDSRHLLCTPCTCYRSDRSDCPWDNPHLSSTPCRLSLQYRSAFPWDSRHHFDSPLGTSPLCKLVPSSTHHLIDRGNR